MYVRPKVFQPPRNYKRTTDSLYVTECKKRIDIEMTVLQHKPDIKAIIMGGGCDFGRCPLASVLPPPLWPVVDKSAIERLLLYLSDYGIKQAVLCLNGNDSMVRNVIDCDAYSMDIRFLTSGLPTGTAGCIRDAAGPDKESIFLVLPAGMIRIPDIDMIIRLHLDARSEMTAVLSDSGTNNNSNSRSTGIYVCQPSILDHIPQGGYFDIKESLIPEVLRAGKTIYAATLPVVGNFRNHMEYLGAIGDYLTSQSAAFFDIPLSEKSRTKILWKSPDSSIASTARIHGPVVIMEGANVSDGAIIFGPAVIGRNTSIGPNCLLANSVLWDYSVLGSDCQVENCVVDYQVAVPPDSVLSKKAVVSRLRKGILGPKAQPLPVRSNSAKRPQPAAEVPSGIRSWGDSPLFWAGSLVLSIVFIWSNWVLLKDLWRIWQRSDEYSSGLLVPFLALYVIWSRREQLASCPIRPTIWGLLLVMAAQAIKFFGLFFMYISLERFSIVVSISGLVLMLFGWRIFHKVMMILGFLCLMLPLPVSIHNALILPLQSWSTASAVFCLEVMGYDVLRQGNIIDINGTTVAVAEACNGLRMIMAFFVIGGFIVLLTQRTRWVKILVFISGIPIALFCNTVRLVVTSIAFTFVKGEEWEKLFHDFGGYAMMPLAIAIIVFELWLLARMIVVKTEPQIISARRESD